MTASTQGINLKDKCLHFLLAPSSTQYFGISFLIVVLTRPWNYLFQSERGQSCAGINCENCHLFITIALLVYSKHIRFTNEGLCTGNCSNTCKTSLRKNIFGMQVGIIHNMPSEHLSPHPAVSLAGMDPAPPPCPRTSQIGEYSCSTSPSVTKASLSFKILY